MSEPPESPGWVRQWIEKAEGDLRNAEHTLELEEDCPLDTVCFHAQQCAEKYLKALLVSWGVDFPRTHDLLLQLVTARIDLGVEIEEVLGLNRYSVEVRYPGDWDPVLRIDADEALRMAQRVRAAVRAVLRAW